MFKTLITEDLTIEEFLKNVYIISIIYIPIWEIFPLSNNAKFGVWDIDSTVS